jgi:Kef-type K+ transport system membrane component KefB
VSRTNQVDVLIVAILGVAFGLSFIANQLGISAAAGAFFAGVLVAESKSQATARVLTSPLKDMFAALFFVSVGALMDVSQLPLFIVPALIFVATSFAAKFITVYLSSKSQGLSKKASTDRLWFVCIRRGTCFSNRKRRSRCRCNKCFCFAHGRYDDYHYVIFVSLCCQVWMESRG